MTNSTLPQSIIPPTWTPWYYSSAPSLVPGLSDKLLTLLCPIVSYWALSLFFHLLDTRSHLPPFSWMGVERYRIHESEDVKKRNRVTPMEVFRAVVLQQTLQTMLGYWWLEGDKHDFSSSESAAEHIRAMQRIAPILTRVASIALGDVTAARLVRSFGGPLVYAIYWWGIPIFQIFVAFFVIDTWQYFLHRLFHVNKFLYKHIHSVHHRLYVPYAYGALYNHPFEGFLFDSLGAACAESISGMSVRQSAFLFAFSSAKTVDDHCGFSLPWDPLQFMYRNNARYHDVHHQIYGLKYNFSQPFWIHWDILLGTRWDGPDMPPPAERKARTVTETKELRDVQAREQSPDSELSSDSGIVLTRKDE